MTGREAVPVEGAGPTTEVDGRGGPGGPGTILAGLAAPLVTREGWGAEPAVGWPVEHATLRAVVVHHTGTRNDDPDPLAMLRRVQHFHAQERGWGDIGYSFVVLEDGRVAEGREGSAVAVAPTAVVAGHAFGHNPGTLGVALAGRFHHTMPTVAAWDALVDLVTVVCRAARLDPLGGPVPLGNGRTVPAVVGGHRHVGTTPCPGDTLTRALPSLAAAVHDRLAP